MMYTRCVRPCIVSTYGSGPHLFAETKWYSTVNNTYGVPLDTRHTYTKSDWELWTAAWVTDTTGALVSGCSVCYLALTIFSIPR